MNKLILTTLVISLFSCNTKENPKKPIKPEKLIEVKDGVYSEWYPGKKQLKFKGAIDKKGNRDGKWVFYSQDGKELSMTVYNQGVRDGYSIVKYPNGALHYRGEYHNDTMVGTWVTYDEKGTLINEKDYGNPNE